MTVPVSGRAVAVESVIPVRDAISSTSTTDALASAAGRLPRLVTTVAPTKSTEEVCNALRLATVTKPTLVVSKVVPSAATVSVTSNEPALPNVWLGF